MENNNNEKIINYNIIQYLQGIKEKYGDNDNVIDNTCQYLERISGFNLNSTDNFKELSYSPISLDEIITAGVEKLNAEPYGTRLEKMATNSKFNVFVDTVARRGYFEGAEENSVEYLKRHSKVLAKFQTKMEAKAVEQQKEDEKNANLKLNREQLAEEKKAAGNVAISQKNFEEAVALYSEAIALSSNGPNSHIYYSNRAAAYCHQNNYYQAAVDCERSIALNSTYVKAHSRLGMARFFLGQYKESIAAYENAVRLEPSNKSHSDSLKQAKQKLEEQQKQSVASTPSAAPASGGMPDLSALAGLMGGGGAGGAGGAGGGLASLLQNPQMMQMAQQMMQNPQLMQQAMSMMGGGGGAGGMPDMSALASMFGGAGGAGANNPFNNTSNNTGAGGGGLPSFSGFVDENR